MPTIETIKELELPKMTVFFLLETSGRMKGEKISILNHTMEQYVDNLKRIAKIQSIDLEVIILEFNSGANLITKDGPVKIEDFEWEYVENGGLVDLGAGLKELFIQLEKNMKQNRKRMCFPIFIFMSTGWVTDDYENALVKLRKNMFFRGGVKVAVAIGDDVDIRILFAIAGNGEAVISYTDIDLFCRLFRCVEIPPSDLIFDEELYDYKNKGEEDKLILMEESSKVIVHLSGNDIRLYNGESYQCTYCEVLPCSPEDALEIALEIKYLANVWGDKKLEVKNCSLENIYLKDKSLFTGEKVEQGKTIVMNENDALVFKKKTLLLTFEKEDWEDDDEW